MIAPRDRTRALPRRTAAKGVTKAQIARVIEVLKENGVNPTGAEIDPDGTVRLFSGERGTASQSDGGAFDAWWAQNGQAG